MKTVFLRVLEAEDKAAALLEAVREPEQAIGRQRFEVDACAFERVPGSPFAYWVSERFWALFEDMPPFEAEGRTAKVGIQTSDDFRFVRCSWEMPTNQLSARWYPLAKGGRFSPHYADLCPVVNWAREGEEMKAFAERTPGTTHWSRKLPNTDLFFRPGLTWPLRGTRFSAQAVPADCVFSIAGDDGVVLAMAPLFRLVPQYKPWQKELKSKWDELGAGKYDWAHLAMHLWPERVVPKCATDRSLAIAHGLEEVFWVEGSNGKWTARAVPVRPIAELVRERSSPAVKAALKSLLEAPIASGQGGRKKNGRGRSAAL